MDKHEHILRCSNCRNISDQKFGKTTDDIIQKRHISPTYRRRGFPRDLNVDTADNDFRLHFPARSAPSSGYSSPLLSPQRYSTVDLFHPSFQVSSALEFPTSDRISKSHQLRRYYSRHSPLYSPMSQSPSKHGNSRNCNCGSIHSRNKSLPESSAAGPDANNANVHPLPRPPTISRPSPAIRYSFDKSDISSVKGQWQRGRPIGRGTYGSVYIATHRYVKVLEASSLCFF
ncbi:UNVERIFIED_CONTAM: Mitogen-activated protein kinase kinase kinase [Sesamum latifolium]|uniref:Mitogen-activated protein kinase kinase kinase n=1 Tax=Sesamum latifolium TaxID=2727402 RepID=A0AAW2WA21_9LAMI